MCVIYQKHVSLILTDKKLTFYSQNWMEMEKLGSILFITWHVREFELIPFVIVVVVLFISDKKKKINV